MTSITRTISYRLEDARRSVWLPAASAATLLLLASFFFAYLFFIQASAYYTAQISGLDNAIAEASSRVSDLETQYLAAIEDLSPGEGKGVGFSLPAHVSFVSAEERGAEVAVSPGR